MTIVIENKDIAAISACLMTLVSAFLWTCEDTLGSIALGLSYGDNAIFYFGCYVLHTLAFASFGIIMVTWGIVMIWWFKKTEEEKRGWL